MLSIPHQLVSAPIGYNVTLECFTEAHPNSLNYWTRGDGQMIHEGKKYHIQSRPLELPYKTQMKLTIYKLRQMDLGTYKCVAKNPRGETDGSIRLYESALMTSTAQSTLEDGNDKDTQIEISSTDNRTNEISNAKFDKGTKIHSSFNSIEKFSNKEREHHQQTDHLGVKNAAYNVFGHNVVSCTIIFSVAMSIFHGEFRRFLNFSLALVLQASYEKFGC
ncbi:hypothetical protein GE061_000323 [Apolygus lucorum]|uniref:Uncharacterized protein n=1 Tax=Apolygus lucorum TaxID=248454 RepID=A0A6A4K0Q2_APOLU|nr:hypothetical protein GE061_000323 [Apolygus lucorum]